MLVAVFILLLVFAFVLGYYHGITKIKEQEKPQAILPTKRCRSCGRLHNRYDNECLSCEDIRIGLS